MIKMETTPIGWGGLVSLALGTGAFTAIVNNGLQWLRDLKKESTTTKRDAQYLAMRVSVILERFAIDCIGVIVDNHLHGVSEGHAGTAHGKLPPLAGYPADEDWKALDPSLSVRALSLDNDLRVSENTIKFWWDVEPGNQGILKSTVDMQAGKCGYRAWRLAVDIRRRYRLPEFESEQQANIELLKEEYDRELKSIEDGATAFSKPY
jgi:hypothetical protein